MKWLILTWSLIWWRHHISRINLFRTWCCWCRSRARWTLGLLSISKRTLTLLLKMEIFKTSAEMDLFTCWALGSFPYPRGHSLCPPPCVDLSKSSNVLFAGSAILKNFHFFTKIQKSIFEFEIFSVTLDFSAPDPHDPDEPQHPPLVPLDGADVPHPVVFSTSSKSGGK